MNDAGLRQAGPLAAVHFARGERAHQPAAGNLGRQQRGCHADRKQRRYIVTRRPYYPSVAEMTEAMKWLADRGFGQAPKTVQIEGSTTTGFKMVFRRWAPARLNAYDR